MILAEFNNDPINAYLKCERYVNDGSPSKNNNTTSLNTAPKSGKPWFHALEVKFNKNVKIIRYGEEDSFIHRESLVMHPDFIDSAFIRDSELEIVGHVKVAPTSSGRTVLCVEYSDLCFLKLAYPKCLGRLTRHMGSEKILSAVEVTERLVNAVDNNLMNSKFALLKENKGKVAVFNLQGSVYEWGMIKRDFKPYPYMNDGVEYYMPFFSLFSKEYTIGSLQENEEHVPFLIQFCEAQSKSPIDFLLFDVVYPLLDCYFDSLLKAGIELEAHAQNMLISFDDQFMIHRIVCRDLESAGRDVTLMERLGISFDLDNEYKCNRLLAKNETDKYPKWYITHSFMFDFKLGEYILTPLIDCFLSYYPDYSIDSIQDTIREYNQKYIQLLPDFFPPDWCYYSAENFEETKNRKEYIWEPNPKYR